MNSRNFVIIKSKVLDNHIKRNFVMESQRKGFHYGFILEFAITDRRYNDTRLSLCKCASFLAMTQNRTAY